MNHKDIRQQINKQLKKQYPGWGKLSKKQKKEIARNTLVEVIIPRYCGVEVNSLY